MNQTDQTERSPLDPIKGPELVFGLVGPVGTDMKFISKILEHELKVVSCDVTNIHVTDLFELINHDFKLDDSNLDRRYTTYIATGNKLRGMLERPDAFALLSVAAIRKQRINLTGDRNTPATRHAYLLNQFKRPEEIQTLRRIYGRGFIQISAYSSKGTFLRLPRKPLANTPALREQRHNAKGWSDQGKAVASNRQKTPTPPVRALLR